MREDMRHQNDDARRTRSDAAIASGLARLGELDDYKVAEGDPDIRGWDVKTVDGRSVGKVNELIVDLGALRVRYVEVEADKNMLGVAAEDRYFLVPIGTARLDEGDDDVIVDRLPAGGFTAAPFYQRGRLTSDYETSLRSAYGAGDDLYDDRRFWGNRRRGRDGTAYVARSE